MLIVYMQNCEAFLHWNWHSPLQNLSRYRKLKKNLQDAINLDVGKFIEGKKTNKQEDLI